MTPWYEPYERAAGCDPYHPATRGYRVTDIFGGLSVETVARRTNMCRECGCSHDLCSEMGCTDGDYLTRWHQHAEALIAELNARHVRLRDLWRRWQP